MNAQILIAGVFCALAVLSEGFVDFTNCDFETGVCEWRNVDSATVDWLWSNGEASGPDDKPIRDVTVSNIAGHYIYADISANQTGTPSLASPLVPAGHYCFLFYIYSTTGTNAGVKVLVKESGEPIVEVKVAKSNRDNLWRRALVPLNYNKAFTIGLQAVLLNGAQEALVAVDEFHIEQGNC